MGYCLPLRETFVTRFVCVCASLLHSLIQTTILLPLQHPSTRLSLFPSEDSNRLALICIHLVYIPTMCGPLKRPSHLFGSFPTIYNYFNTILIYFTSIIEKLTLFFRL
jgi:hypothetical protein